MNERRIRKEIRALLQTWLGAGALMLCLELLLTRLVNLQLESDMWNLEQPILAGVLGTAMLAGCFMLSALSFGLEYDSKTMNSLLAQPVSRVSIWKEKMVVLFCAVVSLYLLFAIFVILNWKFHLDRSALSWQNESPFPLQLLLTWGIVPFCAAGTTPFLTLFTRSTLGGAIMAVMLPVLLVIDAVWMLGRMFTDLSDEFYFTFCWVLVLAYSIAFCLLGFRRFIRLEALDSGSLKDRLRLPFRIEATWQWNQTYLRRLFSGPVSRLVKKEFHLQWMSFFGSALFALVWLSYRALGPSEMEAATSIAPFVFGIYIPVLATIIGAVSIAGERSLGIMDWQFTLPISRRTQWLIKLTVVTSTCLLLCLWLPLTISGRGIALLEAWNSEWYTPFCILMPLVAVFASSFSNSPIRAIIRAVGIVLFSIVLWIPVVTEISNINSPNYALAPLRATPEALAKAENDVLWGGHALMALTRGSFYSLVVLIGVLSFLNYRQVIFHTRRMFVQLSAVFGVVLITSLLLLGIVVRIRPSVKVLNQDVMYRNEHPLMDKNGKYKGP